MSNSISVPLRDALRKQVFRPTTQVLLRRLMPGFERIAWKAANYVENPDLVGGSAQLNAAGAWQAAYGGWNMPVAFDAENTSNAILKILAPAAWGENATRFHVFLGDSRTPGIWESPLISVTVAPSAAQKQRTRGGLNVYSGLARYYYLGADGGVWMLQGNESGSNWNSPNKVYNTTRYLNVIGAAVAPVRPGRWFVYYTLDERTLLVDYYTEQGLVIDAYPLGYCFDEIPHWSALHYFDAVEYFDKIFLVANTSKYGASRGFFYDGLVFSEPISILPYSDADWNGLLRIAGLSIIRNRLYAVASQRFLQSDDSYSQELVTLTWSNDGLHWSQAPHLYVGLDSMAGKVFAQGNNVYVVGNATLYAGLSTVDFGDDTYDTLLDISSSVTQWTLDRLSDGSGSSVQVNCKRSGVLMQPDDWLPYADQILLKVGEDLTTPELISTAFVQAVEQPMTINRRSVPFQASGSLARLAAYEQFADDFANRSVANHADMSENILLNRANSIWSVSEGRLYSHTANADDQSLVYFSDRMWGGFTLAAKLQYEVGVTSFGIVVWAGLPSYQRKPLLAQKRSDGTDLYTSDELSDHNYTLIRFTPSAGNVTVQVLRRTGVKSGDAWTEQDTVLASFGSTAWPVGAWRTCHAMFRAGKLSLVLVDDNGASTTVFDQAFAGIVPEEWLAGLYLKSPRAETSEGAEKDKLEIKVTGADEWALTGQVDINGNSYDYTLNPAKDTMTLNRSLSAYLSKGTVITPVADRLIVDWMQLVSSGMRWSAADICRHVSMRAGIALQPDNLAPVANWIHSGGNAWNGSTWPLSSGMSIRAGCSFGDYASEIYVTGFDNGDYVEWRPWSLAEASYSPFQLRLTKGSKLSLRDAAGIEVAASPVWSIPSESLLRLVTDEGWFHVYCNGRHLASVYSTTAKRQFGEMAVSGSGVSVAAATIEAGCEYVVFGIWDGQTSARDVIGQVLNGLPLGIVENTNTTLRLLHLFYPDDLGEQAFEILPMVGYGRPRTQRGALSAFGGYDWSIEFDPTVLAATGLRWGKLDNDSLLSLAATRHYAALEGRRQAGELRQFQFEGRFDPAMQVFDSFTIPGFANYLPDTMVVTSITVTFGNASLVCKGTAIGKPERFQ